MASSTYFWRGALMVALGLTSLPVAQASDHNEPSPDPVWPAESALHKEWDISDLFAWYDSESDKLNFIVAWHPQQDPMSAGQQVQYNSQVLYRLHIRYERKGAQVFGSGYFEREITVRYGQRPSDGQWGMLVTGLPGTPPAVLDTASEFGWVGHALEVGSGKPTDDVLDAIEIGTGMWDDPFVFDLDGFNDSLSRALSGEEGLMFDPKRDTFEGLNMSAFVVSIPIEALRSHWEDFDPSGSFATEHVNVWATTHITESEVRREARGGN